MDYPVQETHRDMLTTENGIIGNQNPNLCIERFSTSWWENCSESMSGRIVLHVCECVLQKKKKKGKKGPHGLDGAVEKYFWKGENTLSRFSWGKVVDVYWEEEVEGAGI